MIAKFKAKTFICKHKNEKVFLFAIEFQVRWIKSVIGVGAGNFFGEQIIYCPN